MGALLDGLSGRSLKLEFQAQTQTPTGFIHKNLFSTNLCLDMNPELFDCLCRLAVFLGSGQRYRGQIVPVTLKQEQCARVCVCVCVCECVCVCVMSTCLFSRTAWSACSVRTPWNCVISDCLSFKQSLSRPLSQLWPLHRSPPPSSPHHKNIPLAHLQCLLIQR